MKKLSMATTAVLALAVAAAAAHASPGVLLESFENTLGPFQIETGGQSGNLSSPTGEFTTTQGVTDGTYAMVARAAPGYWLLYKEFDYNIHQTIDTGGTLTVDVSIAPGSFSGTTYCQAFIAAAGDQDGDGIQEYGFTAQLTDVPIDGAAHTISFTLNDDAHQMMPITNNGYWGCWFGINTSTSATTNGLITFDNFRYLPAGGWSSLTGGNFTDGSNWNGGTAPVGADQVATFGQSASDVASVNVNIDQPITVGELLFNGTTSYHLSGTNLITLARDDGTWPSLEADAGSHRIDAPIYLANDGTNITVAAGAYLSVASITKSNSEAYGGYSNKYGAGTLEVDHWDTGGVTIFAGTIAFQTQPLNASRTPVVNIMQGFFKIDNDGGAYGSRTYYGQLDVGTSDMILRGFGGTDTAGKLADLQDMARAGQNGPNGLFTGNGITSSVAAADANGQLRYAVGVIQNDFDGTQIYSTFDGVTVGDGDILVKFTYFGDADLNGVIDDTDFFLINNGYGLGLSGWINGDFDYSGVVDDTDFFLINNAFGQQGGSLRASGVPEPTGMGVWALAAVTFLGRRSRK